MGVVLQGSVYPAELVAGSDLTGATIQCVVTAPDLTSAAYSGGQVTVAGSTATVSIPAVQTGTYLIVWTVSGTVSGVQTDQFTVAPARIELASVGFVREQLNIADTSKDDKLREWLSAAGDLIETVTGPIRPAVTTQYFDGGSSTVVLRSRWVSAVRTVTETWGATLQTLTEQPLGASVDAYGYTWNRDTNEITRRTYGGGVYRFSAGPGAVAVTYVAGLTTIPGDVQLATARLIAHWYRKSESAFRGTSFGGGSSDDPSLLPGNYMLPNEVMELLEAWRRPPEVA